MMARNSIAAAEVALRSEGLEDPQATLLAAELQLREAQSQLEEVICHADAIALLHCCFQEEQRALSEQFTRPLADKISTYLQCLFGPAVRAGIELKEGGFEGLCLTRGGSSERFAFDSLSGGTQEQTAAAVRLAMANVLAADHHGSLPVVFDDAFVYSDADRVQRLQRMLNHAADAGLQVIVLTCSPGDYVALGAHQINLRPPEQTPPVPADADTQRPLTPGDIRATEAEQARFLERLHEAGGAAGNATLRESLGLDEPDYDRIKQFLVASRQVIVGRGRGGSIALVGMESAETQ